MDEETFDRKRFLAGAAGLVTSALAGAAITRVARARSVTSPIRHVVVVMMENRSFDHFLGWLPGADGRQAGLQYPDRNGVLHSTYHLTDRQGCTHPDPDHSYEGGRAELDDGRADGWLQAGLNDDFVAGYYTRSDLPFLGEAALRWTACDRYFSAILGPTYPNRIYQHAGITDRIVNTTTTSTLPTIWDRLSSAGLTGLYYYSDIPFLALWGSKYVSIGRSFDQFLADCAAGTLPSVSFVDPRFQGEDQGISNDDHPHADILVGESFLDQVYTAVTSSPAWPSTVLTINYDEWGGFFDHVAPARVADGYPHFEQRGFRVPALVVSPYARRGVVAHDVLDHTSILKLIESTWGLAPLAVRDANATSLAATLDLGNQDLSAPAFDVPTVAPVPCAPAPMQEPEWTELAAKARAAGWQLGQLS